MSDKKENLIRNEISNEELENTVGGQNGKNETFKIGGFKVLSIFEKIFGSKFFLKK